MPTLLILLGPNGVGKSTTADCLHARLPRSARLESEWCRMINPFDLTPEVEALTVRNLSTLLRGYLECSLVDTVIFTYGLHGPRRRIYDAVLENLCDLDFRLLPVVLTCSEEENKRRMAEDGRNHVRLAHALTVRPLYDALDYPVIDTTGLTVEESVDVLLALL